MMCVLRVNTAMGPQSPQRPVPLDIFVRMARNLTPSIPADQERTTMSLTKPLKLPASYAILGSTVRVMEGYIPMATVMKVSSALVDLGPSVLETLVWLTMIVQQAPLTAVIQCSNVCARRGTRQQVTYALLVIIVPGVRLVLSLVNLVSTVHTRDWLYPKGTVQLVTTVMTVQLLQISLIVQSVTIVHQEREFQYLAPRENSLTQ